MHYVLALFGQNLTHSLSPVLHNAFAKSVNLNIEYKLIEVSADKIIASTQNFFKNPNCIGANITFPFKTQVLNICDILTKDAKKSGAVNTIFRQDNKLVGDNTDGKGFIKDCYLKNISFKHKKVLILGAGGAARGLLSQLIHLDCQLWVANRNQQHLHTLFTVFPQIIPLSYSDMELVPKPDIIINATSMSYLNEVPPIPNEMYQYTICYDLAYNNTHQTCFTHHALTNKAIKAFDGYGMLVEQAKISFERWFSVSLD